MNPLLKIAYYFLKGLVRFCLFIFFERIVLIHPERLLSEKPHILISNHPNTMLDPLLPAAFTKKMVFFLANYSLFKTPFQNWFFNTFFCIPIQRPRDMGSTNLDNEESFQRADAHLIGGGCLYIAPEGTSYIERRLRPFKTGTARIAFSAASKTNFDLDLRIVPVGLNYSGLTRFRKEVVLNIGEPMLVSDYQEAYRENPFDAVKMLTEAMEEKIGTLCIAVASMDDNRMLRQLEELWKNEDHLDTKSLYFRAKAFSDQMGALNNAQSTDFSIFKNWVLDYRNRLSAWNFSDEMVQSEKYSAARLLRLLLTKPLFLTGFILNGIPAGLTELLAQRLNLYLGYRSAVYILAGLILFPFCYFFEIFALYKLLGFSWVYFFLPMLFVFNGLFAWYWWKELGKAIQAFRLRLWKVRNPGKLRELALLRNQIMNHYLFNFDTSKK